MSEEIIFHVNKAADGTAKEVYSPKKKTWRDKIKNYFHEGIYCVRRCGFYSGNFTIHSKQEMIKKGEYDDKTGCNGIAWVASEGSYAECQDFVRQNQTYISRDY